MKAFFIPTALLTLILLTAMWSGSYVRQYTERWNEELNEIANSTQNEHWNDLEKRILSIYEEWNHQNTPFHIILNHQAITEAESLFSGVIAACREQDLTEFHIQIRQLISQLLFLSETQQASIGNIL